MVFSGAVSGGGGMHQQRPEGVRGGRGAANSGVGRVGRIGRPDTMGKHGRLGDGHRKVTGAPRERLNGSQRCCLNTAGLNLRHGWSIHGARD